MNKIPVLIVGKNSRVWSYTKEFVDFKVDEVSSSDILNFGIQKTYPLAIVFSYFPSKTENAKLLSALAPVAKSVVYISSDSVLYAESGYRYSYPSVKLFCEQYIKSKSLFESCEILRIGLVLETYSYLGRLTGEYTISKPKQIGEYLNNKVLQKNKIIEVKEKVSFPFSNSLENKLNCFYRRVNKANIISFMFTRSLDLVFKKIGITWYGYNERFRR